MKIRPVGHLVRTGALAVTALALAAGASGCKGQAAAAGPGTPPPAAASSAAPAPASPAASTAQAAAAAAASQAPGPGSLSVSVTSPVTLSGTVSVPVSCVAGLTYRASVASSVIHGDQLSYTVAIARYRGPGSYTAVVAVTLRQATGVVTAVAGVSQVPVTINSGGGSFRVSAVGTAGRTFTGSLTWTCGS
jgi:hypothetical protein